MKGVDRPLTVEISNGELVIRVGFNVIKWAAENMDANNPFDDWANDYKRLWAVTDPEEFAKDVRSALLKEEEDGTTPLILLLDKACLDAIEDGSVGIDEMATIAGAGA
jgi:hypothetical protein